MGWRDATFLSVGIVVGFIVAFVALAFLIHTDGDQDEPVEVLP